MTNYAVLTKMYKLILEGGRGYAMRGKARG